MNGDQTMARPYAKAVFEWACQHQQIDFWSQILHFLALVAEDKGMQEIYGDTRYSVSELSEIFISLCKTANLYHPDVENLILLLAHYRRFKILSSITQLYEIYKAALQKTVRVSVVSAFALSDKVSARFKKALENRFKKEVELHFTQDQTLIGGAVIRVGDWVMDGSVKNKLEKLRQAVAS